MADLGDRLKAFLLGQDYALNGLGGGSPRESLSGTIGRACGYGGGEPRWWGPPLCSVVDTVFGKDHCRLQAEKEEKRRRQEPA